jgi:hypothetical protein
MQKEWQSRNDDGEGGSDSAASDETAGWWPCIICRGGQRLSGSRQGSPVTARGEKWAPTLTAPSQKLLGCRYVPGFRNWLDGDAGGPERGRLVEPRRG